MPRDLFDLVNVFPALQKLCRRTFGSSYKIISARSALDGYYFNK